MLLHSHARAAWRLFCLGWGLAASLAWAEDLPLPAYLEEVRQQSAGLQAAHASQAAEQKLSAEKGLMTAPYLLGEASYGKDQSPDLNNFFAGDSQSQAQWMLGLEKKTSFGLSARLAYRMWRTLIEGAGTLDYRIPLDFGPPFPPLEVPVSIPLIQAPDYYTARTELELTFDLWRNFGGNEVRAAADALEQKHRGQALERSFQARQLLAQAETVYWKLAQAQEVIRVEEELLARSRRLYDWVAERVRLKLQDASDLLQAEAQVQVYQLELVRSREQARAAAAAFNQLRGLDSDQVPPGLRLPAEAELAVPEVPEQAPARQDVLALEAQTQAAEANSRLKQESVLPELTLNLTGALEGQDTDVSQAVAGSGTLNRSAYGASLELRAPLDFPARGDMRTGYGLEAEAGRKALEERRLQAQADWQALRRRLAAAQEQRRLALALEQLQQRKADRERLRLQRGSSVTFQVLQFEQDWGKSQLGRIEAELALLELLAQLKVYGE